MGEKLEERLYRKKKGSLLVEYSGSVSNREMSEKYNTFVNLNKNCGVID